MRLQYGSRLQILCKINNQSASTFCNACFSDYINAAEVLASLPPIDIQWEELERLYVISYQRLKQDRQRLRRETRAAKCGRSGSYPYPKNAEPTDWYRAPTRGQTGENLDFHLTQILSGHRCFRSYLYIFHNEISPKCSTCTEYIEDSEHIFFHCFLNTIFIYFIIWISIIYLTHWPIFSVKSQHRVHIFST